ncbi:pyrroline-5-carboxylate reductase [Pelomicrobium sp.]|jgi:pyrroline-5-carboxylate reductase|uniref:pyrroline-5-carboxylate reductase n=1 Tax=Pelomicrobium sp. TaxID=2815319 RepID=UPI002FDD2FC4
MPLTFIGGGNMATALIGGLLHKGWSAGEICVVEIDAAQRKRLAERFGVATNAAPEVGTDDTVLLAVKPQHMREAARSLAGRLERQLVITIAAGIRLGDLARWLGGYRRLVRCMPNTPALVHCGVTGLYALPEVDPKERKRAEAILSAVGRTLWFEQEALLDAVTAVSGSGPAYVFYFIQALEEAAAGLGLEPQQARLLALETFYGAATLARQSEAPVASLRAQVTSKGGTTERALAVLEAARVRSHIEDAVRAAHARAMELGDEFGKLD